MTCELLPYGVIIVVVTTTFVSFFLSSVRFGLVELTKVVCLEQTEISMFIETWDITR